MISILLPIHASCALISIALFIWRGMMMWIGKPVKNRFLRRTLPDGVDTVLLTAGILMAFILGISPLDSPWLAAKIAALLAYIAFGAIALNYGRSRVVKRFSFVVALGLFGYLILVARSMQAWPF